MSRPRTPRWTLPHATVSGSSAAPSARSHPGTPVGGATAFPAAAKWTGAASSTPLTRAVSPEWCPSSMRTPSGAAAKRRSSRDSRSRTPRFGRWSLRETTNIQGAGMSRRTTAGIAALTVTATIALTACTGGAAVNEPAAGAADGTQTITYLIGQPDNPADLAKIKQSIATFEAKEQNVKVKLSTLPNDQIRTVLQTQLRSGK